MRKYYIDNLRWVIILLLIPYHAAMAWNVWGELNYIYFISNHIISSIVVFLSPYFMPLMFLIAGISTRFALQFSVGQFWFILYLFLISLTAIGITLLQRKIIPPKNTDTSLVLICFCGLPLPLFSELLSIGGKSLAEYTYIFLIGYYIFSNDDIISKVEEYKWIFLCVGLTATVLNVYLFIRSDTQHTLSNMIAKYVSEWFMINSLLGIGKRYLNFRGKVSKYMSQRSYTFYIFHFIWVVLFQYICVAEIHIIYLKESTLQSLISL